MNTIKNKSLNSPLKCYKNNNDNNINNNSAGPGFHLPSPPTYLFHVIPNQKVGNLNRKGNQLNPLTTLTRKGYYESFTLEPGGLEPVWGLIWGV